MKDGSHFDVYWRYAELLDLKSAKEVRRPKMMTDDDLSGETDSPLLLATDTATTGKARRATSGQQQASLF